MRNLILGASACLTLSLLFLCTGCLATSAALDALNIQIGEASEAALVAKATIESVTSTQAEVDAAMATLVREGQETKDALMGVKDAMVADVENAKGFTGFGGGADGGVIGLGLTALAWFMRDRRKRLGGDPLQRKDIPTPPTTA